MFRSPLTALLFMLTVCAAQTTIAAGIYKWQDENGKIHFGDRPPADAVQADEVTIRDIPESEQRAPSDAERRIRQEQMLQSYERERMQKKQAAAKEKAQRKKLARQCEQARKNLQHVKRAVEVYGIDNAGNKVVHSQEQRDQATRELEAAIRKNCG